MTARYQAMLTTAMALAEIDGDARARTVGWRQIVDIVAQAGNDLAPESRARAFDRLSALRLDVAPAERRLAAASLAGRTADPGVVALFAQDLPAIAAPFLSRAVLGEAAWEAVIPAMPPASRNILRNRRDLPPAALRMLARYASGDLALPGGDGQPAMEPASGVTQIRELVERIEAYRQRTPLPAAEPPPSPERAHGFAFETDLDGTIDWVEGAPRAALIGLSLADAAFADGTGVDAGAAAAWRRRAPINDARLHIAARGATGGDWLLSATPLFNPRDGRYLGYRGAARRPAPGEVAAADRDVTPVAPDTLRELVHELRTPLNAIQGFAEMIDAQMLGPAAHRYRERARAIVAEATRLVAMVDDLDTAARIDGGGIDAAPVEGTDAALIFDRAISEQRGVLMQRGVVLDDTIAPARTVVGAAQVERMATRLIAAVAGTAAPGEMLSARLAESVDGTAFTISRPAVLAGRHERALLDPDFSPDGDWPDAPLLGLGFTLRLIAKMATQAGGSLVILSEAFRLMLPGASSLAGHPVPRPSER